MNRKLMEKRYTEKSNEKQNLNESMNEWDLISKPQNVYQTIVNRVHEEHSK